MTLKHTLLCVQLWRAMAGSFQVGYMWRSSHTVMELLTRNSGELSLIVVSLTWRLWYWSIAILMDGGLCFTQISAQAMLKWHRCNICIWDFMMTLWGSQSSTCGLTKSGLPSPILYFFPTLSLSPHFLWWMCVTFVGLGLPLLMTSQRSYSWVNRYLYQELSAYYNTDCRMHSFLISPHTHILRSWTSP